MQEFKTKFWICLVISIPVLLLSPTLQSFLNLEKILAFHGDIYVLFILSTIIFFYGGSPFLKGFYRETKQSKPGMMTLIALAITIAYLYSSAVVFGLHGKLFFWELVTLIDVMLLGHWLEMRSVKSASKALEEIAKLLPAKAHKKMPNGQIKQVKIEDLKFDDKIIIKPGEKIPVDGQIIKGSTSINESLLTGEAKPVEKQKGDQVIGGSINQQGSITVQVKKTGKDSYLSQVIEMVKQAKQSKSQTQNLTDKAAMWLTIIAISTGIITFIAWYWLLNNDFVFALGRTVTVMVIACPHALGLAIPLVIAVSISISAKNGLLIRNRIAFEKMKDIETIVFDKTGTLTKGEFGISDIVLFNKGLSEKELIKYAASLEAKSEHSLAQAIAKETEQKFEVQNFQAIPGKGVIGQINNKQLMILSPKALQEKNIEYDKTKINPLSKQGKTVVFVLLEDKLIGAIALADQIRPEAKKTIQKLQNKGIQCLMLTGDNQKVAQWVANELGLDDYFAEVLPAQKADKIKTLQKSGKKIAMVGDGINDAPALAMADIGIAIGAGTDVAIETADIILVKNNPLAVLAILDLSKKTYKKMLQNLAWATGYNIIALPLAAGVLAVYGIVLSPAIGALLMSLSTVIVAINAGFIKEPKTK